jgi:hypothetical protein
MTNAHESSFTHETPLLFPGLPNRRAIFSRLKLTGAPDDHPIGLTTTGVFIDCGGMLNRVMVIAAGNAWSAA